MPMEDEEIERRFQEMEAKLLEQEHRPWTAIRNFVLVAPQLPKGDARRKSIFLSLIWTLFFSPGGVAVTGGLLAAASLGLLFWQNNLMREGNKLILEQIQAEERTNLQSQRLSAVKDLYGDTSAAIRSEAFLSLTTITKRLYELNPNNTHLINRELPEANLRGTRLNYKETESFSFPKGQFQGARIETGVFKMCLFDEADFSGATIDAAFAGGGFSNLALGKVRAKGAEFLNVAFNNVDFTDFDAREVTFHECYFKNCTIPADASFLRDGKFTGKTELRMIKGITAERKASFTERTKAIFSDEEDWR
jgi:uncharacterized protein YjbI with pentapeptide repeats